MLIDSHCHLVDERYSKSPKELIDEAKAEGVEKLITIGTSIEESKVALKTAEQFDGVFAVVGIYPHEEVETPLEEIEAQLTALLSNSPKIVGVGECGIDVGTPLAQQGRPLDSQLELFEMQIKLALTQKLPIVVHNRNGDEHVLKLISKYRPNGLSGVLHCFTSSWETAQEATSLGFYISISGIITYPSAGELLEVAKNVPADKLLLETDAPFLSPQPVRNQVNEPKYVKITAKTVADLRGVSLAELGTQTSENAYRLFGLKQT